MPIYDSHMSQPFTGNLPGLVAMGPSDLRASSGTAPYAAARLARLHSRQLAGLGQTAAMRESRGRRVGGARVADEASIPAYATNELDLLADEDDVQSNGIFDPFATEPNIYPDAGVFATRYSLPGYLARERMYQPSEVIDATTGRPVVYVNGGAVSMDSAAQIAFLERGRYEQPNPVIQAQQDAPTPDESTVNIFQAPMPIPGTNATFAYAGVGAAEPMSPTMKLLMVGALGLAAGVAVSMMTKKKRR